VRSGRRRGSARGTGGTCGPACRRASGCSSMMGGFSRLMRRARCRTNDKLRDEEGPRSRPRRGS
jgi:hypothetical protein